VSSGFFVVFTVFVACLVEMVEALTIVLALGISRGWRSVLLATAAAVTTLSLVVLIFGSTLLKISDESNPTLKKLWLVMGTLLLAFGLQWMRKAILRISSLLPSRDEDKAYKKLQNESSKVKLVKGDKIDWYAFVSAYKGVLLEGFEVIFIVITFGVSQGSIVTGTFAALAAFVFVVIVGLLTHKPLSKVPENFMKLVVGVLLTTFGTYYFVKGIGVVWPHGDNAVWGILLFYALLSYSLIKWLKTTTQLQKEGN
jgi:uncharacterized membrane protein